MFFWFYDVFFKFLSNNHQIRKLITKNMKNREITFKTWREPKKNMYYKILVKIKKQLFKYIMKIKN